MSIQTFGYFDANEHLSPSFTLADLIVTSHTVDNRPTTQSEYDNLVNLAQMLEELQNDVGPFTILSAYRSTALQDMLRAEGEPVAAGKSFHELGMAIDLTPKTMSNEEFYGRLAALVGNDINPGPWYGKLSEIAYKPTQNAIHLALPTSYKQNVFMALNAAGTYAKLTYEEIENYAKPYLQAIEEAAATAVAAVSSPVGVGTIALILAGIMGYVVLSKPGKATKTA